jgi:hypothetical protein
MHPTHRYQIIRAQQERQLQDIGLERLVRSERAAPPRGHRLGRALRVLVDVLRRGRPAVPPAGHRSGARP